MRPFSRKNIDALVMTDPSAAERAYRQLKADIMTGSIPAGPLDQKIIGDRYRMSVTPVREALARLCAEKFVRQTPHHGYVVTVPSPRRLEGLYDLSASLMDLVAQRLRARDLAHATRAGVTTSGGYAERLSALFREIAVGQTNLELVDAITCLGERLFPARRQESELFAGVDLELTEMSALWTAGTIDGLRTAMRVHHRLRLAHVDAIARAINEQAGDT